MIWKPNVTVAAVIEQNGKFLLVEEESTMGPVFNQPAGHLEANESIVQAAIRETLEETAYAFLPEYLVGIYRWRHEARDTVYLRFAFGGKIMDHDMQSKLDDGIIRAVWLTPAEIRNEVMRHRSPLVMRCVDDHIAGKQYPLDLLAHYD